MRSDPEPQRLGLFLIVPTRIGDAVQTFSAHTRTTLARVPIRARGGRNVPAPSHTDVAFVHQLCRCERSEVLIRADLASKGYRPKCGKSKGCW
jgi:hypothetical protein